MSAVVAGGLIIGGWAIAGENCAKTCAKTAAAKAGGGGCCEKVALSEEAVKALSANAAYQRADELLKSWSEAPAKLVAMTEADKAALTASAEKMSAHPASGVMMPSIELVRESLRTAVQIDKAASEMCAAQCKLKGEATSADAKPSCPKAAAAKLRFEQSAGYVMKASHLIGTASKTAGECGQKSECAKTKKVADGESCPKAKATAQAKAAEADATLVAAKADGEKTCAKAAAAKADGEKSCAKTVAAKADGEKSCAKAVAASADGEKSCAKKAALAAAEGESGCAKAAAMAKADGEKPCPKALAAKAEALVNESGKLLAQWQEATVTLASMDSSARTAMEEACANTISKCPAGRLMPATIDTARELLVEASKLTAKCKSECASDKKDIPAELKELMQARSLLISSAINILERTSSVAKPTKQMAMAQ